jgi:arylsulfatase A-like enzyme
MGSEYDLTPTLDSLAKEGVFFDHALAPGPRTPSSMPVLFTGEFVQEHNLGVYDDYEEKSSSWMERQARIRRHVDRFRTIPERLQELGYDTAGVTANPWTTPNTGFDSGFDVFHAVQEHDDVSPDSLPVASAASRFLNTDLSEWLLTWPDFYDLVLEARSELSEPYFLWVFLLDPHQPYLTPRRYREENSALGMYYSNLRYNRSYGYTDDLPWRLDTRLQRAYRDTVRSVDAFLSRLLSDLEGDDPATVVHADHGEAFGEHGAYGHRLQLYRENLHVPFLVHNAGVSGTVSDTTTLRTLPTCIADIATGTFEPESLTRPFVVSGTEERERTAVRTKEWSYIASDREYQEYLHSYQPEELYRLADDSDERYDILRTVQSEANLLRMVRLNHETYRTEQHAIANAVRELRTDTDLL